MQALPGIFSSVRGYEKFYREAATSIDIQKFMKEFKSHRKVYEST
jgi:hypothetical protein